MYETWRLTRWDTPMSHAPSLRMEYLLDRQDEGGMLEIGLQSVSASERIRYRITFVRYPAYRNVAERYRLELWTLRDAVSSAAAMGWTMIIADSPWIQEFADEPLLLALNENLVHYMVTTEDDVIEVLTNQPPKIEVLGPVDPSEPLPGKSEIYYKRAGGVSAFPDS
jgi:hypothetical protein